MKYLAYIILIGTVLFNLYLNFPETKILADPNDNVFQYSLVYRTNWVWENYGCPLSLECLPNLLDHNVTYWAEGYSLPFYYSHLPQIAIVSSYNLFVAPVTSIFHFPFSLFNYYNWTKYLLLSLFPLPVFLALRLVGFSPLTSALASLFTANYSTDGLYGIDPPSFLWRGYGLTSQLYAMFFMPLALAFTYRTLKQSPPIRHFLNYQLPITNSFLATFFLTLTTAGHLGMGIMSLLIISPFIFMDFNKTNIIKRAKKLSIIVAVFLFILSYWIIPILLNNNYHIISFWDPIWKFNSYGFYEVVRQFFAGEIFDWQRPPIITALVMIGFFTLIQKPAYLPFILSFVMMMLLYFGRTTWGSLIDLIPGMKDFHLHRYIVGVHITSLFLLPAGIDFINNIIRKISHFSTLVLTTGDANRGTPASTQDIGSEYLMGVASGRTRKLKLNKIVYLSVLIIFFATLAYFTVKQTVTYASLNNRWIGEANRAYLYDEKNFLDLEKDLSEKPYARIYAGRPGNWGNDFRLGSTQMYMMFTLHGFDISQFLPETWSPMSENDQNFDERVPDDYDLLNLKYIVSPDTKGDEKETLDFPKEAKLVKKYGPFRLYNMPTTGWFDVVSSPMFVQSDKTNYINLVHLWHRSFPRTWKMHPLISVERNPNIPQGMQRQIKMVDEVSFIENDKNTPGVTETGSPGVEESGITKNIFADFPFVFPEATVSAKVVRENVYKQTYSAVVDVPGNCPHCYFMFKMSYHPNWQVKIDGQVAEKYAVFPMYLAARASPGTHTITVTHKPNTLKVVLLIIEIIAIPLIILFRKKLRF